LASVAIALMAHVSRSDAVVELLGTLDAPAVIAWDVQPASREAEQRWSTARRAWMAGLGRAQETGADWVACLQDDAMPSADLTAALEGALEHVPSRSVVSLYFGTRRPDQRRCNQAAHLATDHRASWIRLPAILWAVGLCVPTDTVERMVAYGSSRARHGRNVDTRMALYYSRQGYAAYHTWPSLVDHRSGPSLVGHSDPNRRAHLHHQGSALELGWTGPVVDATRTPPSVTDAVRSVT
jgi:hypothetical protein